jgi:lactate dehydrogenase-like 2-hydroxyacid dehydrogenase
MYKFGILDHCTGSDVEKEIIGPHGEVILYDAFKERDLTDDISELDAAMVWHHINITEYSLNKLKRCKALVRCGVGYDSVDLKTAGALGIPVMNIPDYGTNDVADHAFALLLAANRKIPMYNKCVREDPARNWVPDKGSNIQRLFNKKLGIVGLGRIGTAVAVRAKAFGLNVVFYDPYLPDGYDKTYQCQRLDSIVELFSVSDFVSIHVPSNDETIGMINESVLRNARKGLTLVNTARGAVVSLNAVYDALRNGIIENFAADVLEIEPPNLNIPLIKAYYDKENWIDGKVILTPHTGFHAVESERELREKAAMAMLNAVEGKPIRNCVNEQFLGKK